MQLLKVYEYILKCDTEDFYLYTNQKDISKFF